MLKRLSFAGLFLLSAAFFSQMARADTFAFTVTGVGSSYSAYGTLVGTVDPNDPEAFDITSGSGFANNVALTLVTPGATEGSTQDVMFNGNPYQYDNIVFPTGTDAYSSGAYVDLYGLLFADGDSHTNFFFQNGTYVYDTDESGPTDYLVDFTLTDTTAVTPEPTSIALLGTGLLGIAGLLRRRYV